MDKNEKVIRVGTRKSQLALIQANHVVKQLEQQHPDIKFEVVAMSTIGDQIQDKALNKIGEKSLFTKELEILLQDGSVDLIVHSLKDLPSTLPPGLVIGAVTEREDPRGALILKRGLKGPSLGIGHSLATLPAGSVIGTSAVRRAVQLKANRPDLEFRNIRGNLNTRLRKLDNSEGEEYSAIILAAAGVTRMGWEDRITHCIDPEICLHAVGQGALGIGVGGADLQVLSVVSKLNHLPSLMACVSERGLMRTLEGGCSAPVAAHGELKSGTLEITGGVWSLDGKESIKKTMEIDVSHMLSKKVEGSEDNFCHSHLCSSVKTYGDLMDMLKVAEQLGVDLANSLLKEGAGKILEEAKKAKVD